MSKDQIASEFKWVSGGGNEPQLLGHPNPDSGASANQDSETTSSSCHFEFLREGYLYMTEEERDHLPHGIYASSLSPRSPTAISSSPPAPVVGGAHAVLIRRTSDPAIKGTWRRRWCVLSQTADGVHLLYYKHQTSFTSCEPPLGVVLMEGAQKLYTIPNHSKSSHVFAVAFPYRIIMFHPDKGSELEEWLGAFQAALNMKDASVSSPLKGLPKQKALRKDSHSHPWPRGHEMATPGLIYSSDKYNNTNTSKGARGEPAQVLSLRSLPSENDLATPPKSPTPASAGSSGGNELKLKGLPKKKALHDHHKSPAEKRLYGDVIVPELDSEEKGAVQFLGFRMLDT